jgi:hypothetical protein
MLKRRKKGLGRGWTDVVYNGFHKVWPQCSLKMIRNYMTSASKRNVCTPFWSAKAQCRTGNCIQVSFEIENKPIHGQDVTVSATVTGKCSHDANQQEAQQRPNRRWLTGEQRSDTASQLNVGKLSSREQHLTRLATMSQMECEYGNTTFCQSPAVLRQAACEQRKKNELHPNVFVEIDIQRQAWSTSIEGKHFNGYIQSVGMYPFSMLLFTERQIQAYVEVIKAETSATLHVDSTGSLIQPLSEKTGHDTIYCYSLVMSNGSLPVCDFLSSWHRAFALQNQLDIFNGHVKMVTCGKSVKPTYVVTEGGDARTVCDGDDDARSICGETLGSGELIPWMGGGGSLRFRGIGRNVTVWG